ncbi:tandem-95 repeat protein [Spirosoma sp. HMF4905]|uniref:Tandem-95 repeat protein n=1 Tax=Spirosoma arboris TaxID=2682092 RepID=A0A7K1SMX1_9BACT|nr:Ig-like domain-containing protein [Spirosoma arboris]MVM35148.1 tandem-95 repeat protein [Spirosoma arboris]
MEQISTPSLRRGMPRLIWATICLLLAISPNVFAQQSSATCNTFIPLTSSAFNSLSVTSSTHLAGLPPAQVDDFSSKGNLIDASTTNTADYSFLIAGSAFIEVKDNAATGADVYPAGTYAGFVISDNTLLSAFGTTTISTYLGNTPQESFPVSSLLSTGLLSGQAKVGFITTKNFDRIRVSFSALGAGTVTVYYAVVERFCTSQALACNTPSAMNNPTYATAVSAANTGFSGVNVATISDPDNAVSSSTTDAASIDLLVSAGSASFAIKDQVTDYPVGTFAGLDISNPGLVNIGALSGVTISTYLNGAFTGQSVSGANLLSVGSSLLSGTGRQTLGFIATAAFDEIKLTVTGVNVAGVTNIYGAVFEKFCAGPSLDCADNTIPKNTITPLVNPASPVYVNGANTGFDGVACVGCSLNNSENIVDATTTNSATLVLTAGVATTASVGVANALDTYPVNSFAGFDIETNALLSANVLSIAVITLYNNGSAVQTSLNNGLIVGAASSPLLNGRSRQYVGVVANVPYDEVKISFVNLVNADLGTINIYNAVFEKTCAAVIACNTAYNLSNPTFPVVIDNANTGVSGVVSAGTTVENPWNVVSASPTDFAKINTTGIVGSVASIAVLDPISTYPVGTFAGFAVQKVTGILALDLFARLTVSTYNNGVFAESRSGVGLLDLSITLFGTTSQFFNVGFVTTKPFDEIKISVAPLVGVAALSALGGSLNVFGAFVDTRTSTGGGLVCALTTNPDFNVTNKNVPAKGNVKTNDIVPVGTTYGPAPASTTQPAGSSPSLTVNSDGTYTFVSATPGVYVYNVPVCGAGLSGTGCATETLTITVLDPTVNTNKPVANPDVASMLGSDTNPSPVTINVKANDGPGNPGGTLGTPTIATAPANGSATVDGSGNVIYTPAAGFYGTDMLTYTVCETPGTSLCASATVTITVSATGSPNTTLAADDYVSTYQGTPVSGNVKTNDTDPEGDTQTITAQNRTIPGIGTLALATNGTYTFTPVAGATGPVDFSYTTTDNGSPSVSANGTLHILIKPFNPNPDFNVTDINVPAPGNVKTNDVVPVGTTYGPTATLTSSPGGSSTTLTLTSTGSYTFTAGTPGVYTYSVPVCVTGTPPVCTTQTLTITVVDPDVTTNNPVANPDFATTTGAPSSPTAVTVNIKANDGPGNPGGALQNPTIPTQPAHGSASIDGSGNLVYTPTAGYYGTDIVTYQICETPSTPACATATVTITVNAPGSPATVSANDDYISTGGSPASGNVLTNDLGSGLSVSNDGTTVTSSGTLVLTSSGSYTFTPAPGATGPVDFTYTACDNNTPSTCASATLHVLINLIVPDLTPTIDMPQANFGSTAPNNARDFVVNIQELAGQSTSSGNVAITITAPKGYTLSYSNAITSINITDGTSNPVAVDNTKWTVVSTDGEQISLKINTGQFIAANTTAKLGFTITRTTANAGSASNITVNVNDDVSHTYDGNPLNNVYARIISGL